MIWRCVQATSIPKIILPVDLIVSVGVVVIPIISIVTTIPCVVIFRGMTCKHNGDTWVEWYS